MTVYALIKNATGEILRRHRFIATPDDVSHKGWRWIPDNPPAFDGRYKRITEQTPVPAEATEVPYAVQTVNLATYKQRRIDELHGVFKDKIPDAILADDIATLRTEGLAKRAILQAAVDHAAVAVVDIDAGWSY